MIKCAFVSPPPKMEVKGGVIHGQTMVKTDIQKYQIGHTGKPLGIETTHPIVFIFSWIIIQSNF